MGEMDIECSWPHIENLEHKEHRNLEIRKHETTSLFMCETFLLLLSWRFRHKERHNLFMPASSSGPYLVRHPWRANSSPLSKPQKSNLLIRRLVSTVTNFLRNPQNPPRASGAWRHPHFVPRFIISGYCDISAWHVHSVHAHALPPASRLHLTNPCAEPKGSQPN